MISVLAVNGQVTLATTAMMLSVMAVMDLATLPRTAPTRFLHQEHHAITEDLTQGINTLTTGGTAHTPIMVPDIEDITAAHIPASIHIATEVAALEGTPHALLPGTTTACTALQPMDASVIPPAVIPTGIVALHPILTISPTGVTHATPWTGAGLAPAAPIMQHKILSARR